MVTSEVERFFGSQSLRVPRPHPDASHLASCEMATAHTAALCSSFPPTSAKCSTSQILKNRSLPPLRSVLPSAENFKDLTWLECPGNRPTSLPDSTSNNSMEPSINPSAATRSLGERSTLVTLLISP